MGDGSSTRVRQTYCANSSWRAHTRLTSRLTLMSGGAAREAAGDGELVGDPTGESLTYTSQRGPCTTSSSSGGGGGGGEASLMDASTVLARSQLRARATAHRR
mmetsp:Transcript_37057/g.108776  ORF Transcript_37057/g.108776 Transcript_37057/m.108776 type:complete len:103 (+) Transcript_37057:91-399(+)